MIDELNYKYDQIKRKEFYYDINRAHSDYMTIPDFLY